MNSRQWLQRLGVQLGLALGSDAEALAVHNGLSLELEGGLPLDIYITDPETRVHCCLAVGNIVGEHKPRLLRTLLAANLAPDEVARGHFALDVPEGDVLLARSLAIRDHATADALVQVRALIAMARQWRERLVADGLLR